MVSKILEGNNDICVRKNTNPTNQIDEIVYKLYDLTYDEVKVVDPEFELTEEEYAAIEID